MLAGNVPQGHVHTAHGVDGSASAAVVIGIVVHLLPEILDTQGVFAHQQVLDAGADHVGSRGLDDGLHHIGRAVHLAPAHQTVVGGDLDESGILAAVANQRNFVLADNDGFNVYNFHTTSPFLHLSGRWPCTHNHSSSGSSSSSAFSASSSCQASAWIVGRNSVRPRPSASAVSRAIPMPIISSCSIRDTIPMSLS